MRSIVKTAAVLRMMGTFDPHDSWLPPFFKEGGTEVCTIMGDLHVVDGAVILHMPNDQISHAIIHGEIDMSMQFFYRKTQPYSSLVMPARAVALLYSAAWSEDLHKLTVAGGRVIQSLMST